MLPVLSVTIAIIIIDDQDLWGSCAFLIWVHFTNVVISVVVVIVKIYSYKF